MYSHAPADYQCPFCALALGTPDGLNCVADIVLQDEQVLAFVSPAARANPRGGPRVQSGVRLRRGLDPSA
jgi:hypothetical protein